ncbi:hypothetical protein Agub_g13374, partial [Astrephomene gubernaculifera]
MHYKDSAAWMMAGIFLYLLDVALRTVQQALNWTRLSLAADTASGAAASISPDGSLLTLSLKCDESLEWHGSDIVCLNVPAVSWWQWHPFTLASSSKITFAGGEKRMVLHIKKYNRWTKVRSASRYCNTYLCMKVRAKELCIPVLAARYSNPTPREA